MSLQHFSCVVFLPFGWYKRPSEPTKSSVGCFSFWWTVQTFSNNSKSGILYRVCCYAVWIWHEFSQDKIKKCSTHIWVIASQLDWHINVSWLLAGLASNNFSMHEFLHVGVSLYECLHALISLPCMSFFRHGTNSAAWMFSCMNCMNYVMRGLH